MDMYEEYKLRLRNLLQEMEVSSEKDGMATLDAFVKDYEEGLYNQIGRLTRQLHDSLNTFKDDEKIFSLTKEDIPSAKERLKYVVDVTEQATQKVLGIIENSIPLSLEISEGASGLHNRWTKLSGAAGSPEIASSTKTFLAGVGENASILHGHLTEILMAQEFQDITGQIIKKVIDLVQDVEDNLVRLIKLTGHVNTPRENDKENIKASGPCVPEIDDQAVYTSGQDDVDQLLASLGF
jgi:chemotaxis protein CheZ